MTPRAGGRSRSDVLIVGDGLIALSIADALAKRGVFSHVIGERLPGASSSAAAGLLAVARGSAPAGVHAFMVASRDMYPAYVTRLERETGHAIALDRRGILEVALDEAELASLESSAPAGSEVLRQPELARLEPVLAHARGALLHENDGSVDNRALIVALDEGLARSPFVRRSISLVHGLDIGTNATVITTTGDRFEGDTVVVAAGAWSPGLAGLPRPLPVTPLKGQMLAVGGDALGHGVMGRGGYLVSRRGSVLVGSTLEPGRFDSHPTSVAIDGLRATLRRLCPSIGEAPERARWAGIRPATPDMLPIVGRDAEAPAVVYACGHAKNGILLAPITGECVADLVQGKKPAFDLGGFAPDRFGRHG